MIEYCETICFPNFPLYKKKKFEKFRGPFEHGFEPDAPPLKSVSDNIAQSMILILI